MTTTDVLPLQVTPQYRRDDGFTMNRVLDRASALDVR
jgi:hypothetical protein